MEKRQGPYNGIVNQAANTTFKEATCLDNPDDTSFPVMVILPCTHLTDIFKPGAGFTNAFKMGNRQRWYPITTCDQSYHGKCYQWPGDW